jgi:hypothetical protein
MIKHTCVSWIIYAFVRIYWYTGIAREEGKDYTAWTSKEKVE